MEWDCNLLCAIMRSSISSEVEQAENPFILICEALPYPFVTFSLSLCKSSMLQLLDHHTTPGLLPPTPSIALPIVPPFGCSNCFQLVFCGEYVFHKVLDPFQFHPVIVLLQDPLNYSLDQLWNTSLAQVCSRTTSLTRSTTQRSYQQQK